MVDALQEFKILTNSFSAEYGGTGGGVILATIKSGTNVVLPQHGLRLRRWSEEITCIQRVVSKELK